MRTRHHQVLFAAAAIALALLAPVAVHAADDWTAPYGNASTRPDLCRDAAAACKDKGYDVLLPQLDSALDAALAKAPANIGPLLKRDQAWFYDMMPGADADQNFADIVRQRIATLARIGAGFDRPGVLGTWEDAFGNISITPGDGGAYRLTIDERAIYGAGNARPWTCRATALVKRAAGGWFTGTILPERQPAKDTSAEQPTPIKIRRQGTTLRVVAGGPQGDRNDARPNCPYDAQITASYFASGMPDAAVASDKAATDFVAPTFDCAHPKTSSDEEICADPELAANDQRLNRAWKALLPRLDEATRRMLTDDQRNWVRVQAYQYALFLHPAWDKLDFNMHFTVDARDELNDLQRERIALLEGFDEHRTGLAGLWLGYTAILTVTPTHNGGLKAQGRKWTQGEWKQGCDYDMTGKVVNGVFRSDAQRTNPDTLERDHASLIVNRLDDAFAAKRGDDDSDVQKCKRSPLLSSTARLFPVRPSPDINASDDAIR